LKSRKLLPALWLTLILATSLTLRLYNINWDEFQHAHPDERWITMVAVEMRPPRNLPEALHPRLSPLNPLYNPETKTPRNFAYGHLPLYILTATAWLLSALGKAFFPHSILTLLPSYDYINLLGRVLSALFDTGTVYLIYLIGKNLYGEKVGLWGASFVALTVSHIQLAHYYAFDPVATFFVVLSLYSAVGAKPWSPLLAGAAAGLAVSSKFSAMPVLAAVVLASWLYPDKKKRFYLLILSLLAAFLAFALTSPFALLDFKFYLAQILEQGGMVQGKLDYPYTRQYRGTVPFAYHVEQQLRWGMGWPLGLASFIGFAWVIFRLLRRKSPPGEIVILAWVLPYFIINGSFMVKFMRYMLPIIPFLCLFGALFLEHLSGKIRHISLAPFVLIPTALWALAFVNGVYGQTHPWIEASRWIYRNIPPGSTIAVEHWDDELPKLIKGEPYPGYRHLVLPLYEEDTPQKFSIIKETLRQADYIIIASNRLYGSIPRLPFRYPMTIRYYELLFAEKLGFEKVAEFSSYPRLGPWVIPDDKADESFTVYDHPKPIVFKKVRDLTDEEWEKLLGGFWEEAIPGHLSGPPGEDRKPPLLLSTPVDMLPEVDDYRWNHWASSNPLLGAITWWFVLELIGLVASPMVYFLFRRLHLRGYVFAKGLGLLLLAYLNWVGASLRFTQNRTSTIAILLILMAAGNFWLLWKNHSEIIEFYREKRREILQSELIFLLSYIAFIFIRFLNPDLWHPWNGGEKPMELAFLNAILKSAYFPPYDPYYAGGYINYYYYGLYIVSVLVKLTGIKPTVAFNLAIPTLFALTFTGAFSLGVTIGGRMTTGLLSAFFVALLGNLAPFGQLVERLSRGGIKQALMAFDYWAPSRVIPYTINEFPFWSFLFADLHPHVIAMPFDLLFMALILEAFLGGIRRELALAQSLSLGTLAVVNTWNFPVSLSVAAMALILNLYREKKSWWNLLLILVIPILALALFYPFFSAYKPISAGIGLVRRQTDWAPFVTFWGFFLASSILAGFSSIYQHRLFDRKEPILLMLIVLILAIKRLWTPLTILLAAVPFLRELFRREKPAKETFACMLVVVGLAVLMGCEFFYFKDFLQESEYYRMNTVFKFYVQAWVLLGIGLAYPFQAFLKRKGWEMAKVFALALLVLSSPFLIFGTMARVRDRFPEAPPPLGTLDGMEFMRYGTFSWPDEKHLIELRYDYEAIHWLLKHIRGTPVLAEAPVGYYREFGVRVSSFTGLPTLLGMHQSEQRYGDQVGKRAEEAWQFFASPDLDLTLKLIRKHRISYVYIGQLERILFSPGSLDKFEKLAQDGWLKEVFRNEKAVIYQTFVAVEDLLPSLDGGGKASRAFHNKQAILILGGKGRMRFGWLAPVDGPGRGEGGTTYIPDACRLL